MELVKYRDWGMPTYTYFWINREQIVISPYFDSEFEANQWLRDKLSLKQNSKNNE